MPQHHQAGSIDHPGRGHNVGRGGDALALDHSAQGVTVYTNGLAIASRLENSSHLSVIVTGGLIRPLQHSLVNPLATVIFRQINADIAFVGCNGIDRIRGVTNLNVEEAEVKTAMISAARRRILIADSRRSASSQWLRYARSIASTSW